MLYLTADIETAWFDAIFSNIVMFVIYAIPLVVFCNLLIRGVSNRKNVRLPLNLAAIMGSYFFWLVSLLLRFVVTNETAVYVLTFLPYVFSTLAISSILFFALEFYNLGVFCSNHVQIAALLIPIMTFVLIILGAAFGINEIRIDPVVSIAGPETTHQLNSVFGEYGIWHNFTHVYCALLTVATMIVVFSQHFRLPRIYRDPSKRMISALLFLLIAQLFEFMNMAAGSKHVGTIFPVDLFFFGMMFSIQFLYRASLGNQGLVFLSQACNDIINCLDQSILILDEEKRITYANEKGSEWIEGLHLEGRSYLGLIDRLLESATQCEKLDDESGGSDFYFDIGDTTKSFNLREKPIVDNKQRQIGTYVVYSDVTENRALIQRLEVGAGRDALTGLRNRGMMEHLKTELDKPDSLPFSVIVCDLNDLKTTNDTYGHQQGDIMLRVAGEVISDVLPPTAQAGRMGGDEFLILLPQTTIEKAEQLSKDIHAKLLEIDEYPYKITMAMGIGVKLDAAEELRDVMIAADESMYKNKYDMKGSVRVRASIV